MNNQQIINKLKQGRKVYCKMTRRVELGLKDQLLVIDLTTGRARNLTDADRDFLIVG